MLKTLVKFVLIQYSVVTQDLFLLADINGTVKIVGLCYAGSTNASGVAIIGYACRIDDVADQLGIEQYVDTATDAGVMVDPSTIEYITIPGQSDEKFILCENEEYWQVGFTGSLEANCSPTTTTSTTPAPTTTTTSSSTSTSTSTQYVLLVVVQQPHQLQQHLQ